MGLEGFGGGVRERGERERDGRRVKKEAEEKGGEVRGGGGFTFTIFRGPESSCSAGLSARQCIRTRFAMQRRRKDIAGC